MENACGSRRRLRTRNPLRRPALAGEGGVRRGLAATARSNFGCADHDQSRTMEESKGRPHRDAKLARFPVTGPAEHARADRKGRKPESLLVDAGAETPH